MTPRPRYLLLLEAESGPVPAAVRLRRALKYLLRVQGLKCVSAEEVPAGDSPGRRDTRREVRRNEGVGRDARAEGDR